MADFRRSVRDLFLQGVEVVNSAANQVVTATRTKVDEMNLRNQRKEVLDIVANTLYVYWMQGLVELPEVLTEKLEELKEIDAQIATIEQQANSKPEAAKESVEPSAPSMAMEEDAEEEAAEAAENEAAPSITVQDKETETMDEPAGSEVPTFNSLRDPEEIETKE